MSSPSLRLITSFAGDIFSADAFIGKTNEGLPWELQQDLAFFKQKTLGHVLIMGRKTYESLPVSVRPLPGRFSLVLSRKERKTTTNKPKADEYSRWVESFQQALDVAKDLLHKTDKWNKKKVYVIGGAALFAQALPKADTLVLTQVFPDTTWLNAQRAHPDSLYFPKLHHKEWIQDSVQGCSKQLHPADKNNQYAFQFLQYQRKRK